MRPPRILFVYQFLTLGGVEVVMQTRLRELARRKIEARVLFLESYGGESLFEKMSDQVVVRTEVAEIEKYLVDFNPDWISTIDTPAILPTARRVVPEARIAYEVHTPYPASYAVLLDPRLFDGVSGIIVPSQSQKEFIALRMARPLPIKVVANSIPEEFFQQTPLPHPPKRPIVMWVGRLDAVKNWRGFVELAAQIRGRTDAEFLLVGGLRSSNQEQENLFEAVKQAKLMDSLRWLPAVNYEDMPRLYSFVGRSGGCLVSTSWAESFGMAALEAMALRCPVVAPDVVGLRDVVKHNQTGWLYPPMNLHLACDFILESFQNLHARQIVIENAERMARSFTPAATVDQLLEAFSEWSTDVSPKTETHSSERERLVDQLRTKAQLQAAQVAEKRLLVESLSEKEQAVKELTLQLTEREQITQSLSAQTAEQEQIIQSLLTQIAEKEESLQALSIQLAKQQGAIESLSTELEKQREMILSLAKQSSDKDQTVQALSAQVSEKEQTVQALTARLAEKEDALVGLQAQVVEKEQVASALAAQLARKEQANQALSTQLEKITSSLGWRLLSLYGPIKYRYLLPIYRLLGLAPSKPKRAAASSSAQAPPAQESEALAPQEAAVETKHQIYIFHESNAYDVLCFPIIDWDFRFQRPQQLMTRFAAAGHRVFYIAQGFRSSGEPYTIQEKAPRVYEVSLRGLDRNIYRDALDDQARDILFASLDALRHDLSFGATAAIVQLPFWWPLVKKAATDFSWAVIYDCMDFHSGFSTNEDKMLDQERELLSSADLVIVSASLLEEKARRYNSNVLAIRNGCDYEHFSKAGEAGGARPVIGYYGAIADWFDSDLVADLAQKRPDWDFVLVGSTFSADISRLSKLPNVSLPGEKPYREIPDWLARFDVAIIPFKRLPLTEATNPVKAYEILSSGKPLVCVPIPEMASLAPLVRLASNAKEFEEQIAAALEEDDPKLVEGRREFAKQNTWEKRFESLAPAVREAFPKASIIIVTFHNLELNRLCLESLYGRTEWPNFEVIVVDNGSTDGTPEYLKQAEKKFQNLRVILNGSNLGFAAANNIGLKQATGDYLVLLNNDTVVTRGWLSTLIKHLRADPEIGLIGPVTNEIGNEAKVQVGYERLEDMPRWAASFVRANDGQKFSIPVLAMFCVAMRREVFERIGSLDESFQVGMFEDDDYTRRMREEGYKVVCARDSFIHHAGRASFKLLSDEKYSQIFEKNRKVYEKKWGIWEPHLDEKDRARIPGLCDRLRQIVAKSKVDPRRIVVFLPSIGWNTPLVQRPHHIAAELTRQGFLVFFDCSGSIIDNFAEFVPVETNLWLYKGPKGVLDRLERPILWTFPYNAPLVDRWTKPTIVYDWIDDLSVFPYEQSLLRKYHDRMLKRADLVLYVARNLKDQMNGKRADALYVPNGVEYERFSSPAKSIELDFRFTEMLDDGRPIVGYYGAIASWFDVEMLAEVARLREDWNFVIIGHKLADAPSLRKLKQLPNVLILRAQPYETLPGYLSRFTAAMIPFKINQITQATSPLKLYEYFAGGKPVISAPMPECQAYEEVLIARDAKEFSEALGVAFERSRDPRFQERLRALARENSWTARVRVVVEHLEKNTKSNTNGGPQGEPRRSAQRSAEAFAVEPDKATEVAKRFRRFRTRRNRNFFDALANHLSGAASDPCLPMYFEFAISCNERGRKVADLLQKYVELPGKRYLDIGCAYGGFLVAFAERGAEVTGIDIDKGLLNLARHNFVDNALDAPLLARDATRAEDLQEFRDSFDIITCNDVIEHVEDPQTLLCNIAEMLRESGIAYFEIPNRFYPRFVLQDGHYQLFGITLLDHPEAKQYYSLHSPGTPYQVGHYLDIAQYRRLFERVGMHLTILDEDLNIDIEMVLNDLAELRAHAKTGLGSVPEPFRECVANRLATYLDEVEASPRATASEKRDFLLRYGTSFWRVLGRKSGSQTVMTPGSNRQLFNSSGKAKVSGSSGS